jgi:anti-sigma regulatory factor (Ser/Thr protein kinase)
VIGTNPRIDAHVTQTFGIGWELHNFLELGALPSAVPCARLHTKQILWEWHLKALTDTAELIVSELVTNAVRASAGLTGSRRSGRWVPGVPAVRLWLFSDRRRVLIQVWDGNDKLPAPQHAEPDAETGRGLLLVESLTAEWGSYPPERSSGKVVWATVTQASA